MTSVEIQALEPVVGDKSDGLLKEKMNDGRLRRRMTGPRKIPRSPDAKDVKKGQGVQGGRNKGGRQRMPSESLSVGGQRSPRRMNRRRRTTSEASVGSTAEPSPLKLLRETILEKYNKEGLNLLNSYIKNRLEHAKFKNTALFLQRCVCLQIVPFKYRLTNARIKNTKQITAILDRFSFQAVKVDLKHNRKRCMQVGKLLDEKLRKMEELFDDEHHKEAVKLTEEIFEKRFLRIKDQQTKIFDTLVEEYKLTEEDLKAGEEAMVLSEEREKEQRERRALMAQKKAEEIEAGGDQTKECDTKDVKTETD